jgi:hypothetical protein
MRRNRKMRICKDVVKKQEGEEEKKRRMGHTACRMAQSV